MPFIKLGEFQVGTPLGSANIISASQINGGTITAKEIILAGGAKGILRSQNFESGVSGWKIDGAGNAELNDVTIRGDLFVGEPNAEEIAIFNDDEAVLYASSANIGQDVYATSIIRLNNDWLNGDVDWPAYIGTFPGITGAEDPFLFLSGPGQDTSVFTETAEIRLGWDVTSDTSIANVLADEIMLLTYSTGGTLARLYMLNSNVGFFANSIQLDLGTETSHPISFETNGVGRWQIGVTGNLRAQGNYAVRVGDGSASVPSLTFENDTDTGFYLSGTNQVSLTTNGSISWTMGGGNNMIGASNSTVRFGAGAANAPTFAFENDTQTGMYRVGSGRIGFSVSNQLGFEIRTNSGNPDIYLFENFDNVGNVETLRAVRNGSGTDVTKIGYNSSFLFDSEGQKLKFNVHPVAVKVWKREWFMDLEPISYRHKVSPGIREIKERIPGYQPDEIGFSIENVSQHTNLLTTQGNQLGASIDEKAILAVTVDYVQHLEKRVAALEQQLVELAHVESR